MAGVPVTSQVKQSVHHHHLCLSWIKFYLVHLHPFLNCRQEKGLISIPMAPYSVSPHNLAQWPHIHIEQWRGARGALGEPHRKDPERMLSTCLSPTYGTFPLGENGANLELSLPTRSYKCVITFITTIMVNCQRPLKGLLRSGQFPLSLSR